MNIFIFSLLEIIIYETVRIPLFKNVQAITMGNCKTAPADRPDDTRITSLTARAILPGYLRVINFGNTLLIDASNWRRKLPTGVHFTI